jgi:hypothetical protein
MACTPDLLLPPKLCLWWTVLYMNALTLFYTSQSNSKLSTCLPWWHVERWRCVYIFLDLALDRGHWSVLCFGHCFWGKRSWCPVNTRLTGHRADHSILEEGKISYLCQQLNHDFFVIWRVVCYTDCAILAPLYVSSCVVFCRTDLCLCSVPLFLSYVNCR